MSTEEPIQAQPQDAPMQEHTGAGGGAGRKRPRLDLTTEPRERKRGKTMFGLLLGTLNKAKVEDKERGASDAAKKRQEIEQRLQDKLRKETDSVRRAEEAKKDKATANRKEEELQLKDSIYKLRRTRLPLVANFLSTADHIPPIPSPEDDNDNETMGSPQEETSKTNPLTPPSRSHPPPLYYLPAVLTPAQEAFLNKRKAVVKEATEKEWSSFVEERKQGIEEIETLRKRVAEAEAEKKRNPPPPTPSSATIPLSDDIRMDEPRGTEGAEKAARRVPPPSQPTQSQLSTTASTTQKTEENSKDKEMEVDDERGKEKITRPSSGGGGVVVEKGTPTASTQADEDDAVEY